jgi:hypothetical protein
MGKRTQQASEEAFAQAAHLVVSGMTPEAAERTLLEHGVDEEIARDAVDRVMEVRREAIRKAGQKNMLYGGLWCGGGLIVTFATMSAASGGGSYVVAWGAIIFGAIQFFRGLSQSSGS